MTFYVNLGLKCLYYGTAYQFSLISILFYVFGRCVLLHLEISVDFRNGVFISNWLNHNIIFGNYYSKCFWRYLELFNIYFFPEILMVEVEVKGKIVNPWERWGVLWNPVLSSNTHTHEPPSFKYLEIPRNTYWYLPTSLCQFKTHTEGTHKTTHLKSFDSWCLLGKRESLFFTSMASQRLNIQQWICRHLFL